MKLILRAERGDRGRGGGLVQRRGERLARRRLTVARGGERDRGAAGDGEHQSGDDRQQTLGGDCAQELHHGMTFLVS